MKPDGVLIETDVDETREEWVEEWKKLRKIMFDLRRTWKFVELATGSSWTSDEQLFIAQDIIGTVRPFLTKILKEFGLEV